ncbi:DUF6452 family protein [Chitinophaga parva]|uniref:DUF6452 family protein n=1 Tax=Chitinophaga parva TaxID=2169414 RepID=UPI001056EF27|nr:DUF6452 family protein [Chitinophaga parva]
MRCITYIRSFWYILLLPVFLWACEDQTKVCDQTVRSDFKMSFLHHNTFKNLDQDTALPAVTIKALDKDVIYEPRQSVNLTYVSLTLDPLHDTSKFFILPDTIASRSDTITLIYSREPHFVSAGCGFTTYYSLKSVTSTNHSIDSLHILQPKITTTNDTHVTLYF